MQPLYTSSLLKVAARPGRQSATTPPSAYSCAAIVSAVLNPVDVVKTRRQLEGYRDARALSIAAQLYSEGGVVALWRPGLAATFSRELVYSGCTKGFYPVARDAICGGRSPRSTSASRSRAPRQTERITIIPRLSYSSHKRKFSGLPG